MRVGEILVRNGWIDEETLAMELLEQPSTGMRLCSLLARRGLVTFDQASRVLGERLGVAAVLRHHLNGRDHGVASLIPEAFAREHVVLPIGRLDSGALIVCARDPSPELRDAIAPIVGDFVMAVAPASYLERAVEQAFDIDVPIDIEMPVKKRAVPTIATRPGTRDALDVLLASLPDIDDFGWLLEVMRQYLADRWSAWLLLAVRDRRRAVGIAGHGAKLSPKTIRTLVIDLGETNLLRRAYDERRLVDEPPADLAADDAQLVAALESAAPTVAAIVTGDDVGYLLVCTGGSEDAVVDLGLLAEALGDAFARLAG